MLMAKNFWLPGVHDREIFPIKSGYCSRLPQAPMKKRKSDPMSEPVLTSLDPSHPNYDAILLKRARLEAHRRRRQENRGTVAVPLVKTVAKSTKKRSRRSDD